jgi:hypothetical protein
VEPVEPPGEASVERKGDDRSVARNAPQDHPRSSCCIYPLERYQSPGILPISLQYSGHIDPQVGRFCPQRGREPNHAVLGGGKGFELESSL